MKSRRAVKRDVNLFALIAEVKPLMQKYPFMKNLTGYTKKHHVDILIDILRKADWSQPDEQIAYAIIDKQQKYRKELTAKRNATATTKEPVLITEPTAITCKPKYDIGDAVLYFSSTLDFFGIEVDYVEAVHINVTKDKSYGMVEQIRYDTSKCNGIPENKLWARTELMEKLYKIIDDVKNADLGPLAIGNQLPK